VRTDPRVLLFLVPLTLIAIFGRKFLMHRSSGG
jgi:hypothetical protein